MSVGDAGRTPGLTIVAERAIGGGGGEGWWVVFVSCVVVAISGESSGATSGFGLGSWLVVVAWVVAAVGDAVVWVEG